jgi:phage/plasmid-associated DNA primase
VANGVVDLRSGTLRAGWREDRITLHSDVPFEAEARCSRWLKFLDEVFERGRAAERRKTESAFSPVAKFWLAVNHKPKVTDDSHGFWRSVRLIPFLRQFKGQAEDKNLAAHLAEDLPGIQAWPWTS